MVINNQSKTINHPDKSGQRGYAMRAIDFSKDNLPVQWQYVKRNLSELGIGEQLDHFEKRAHKAIQKLIQDDIYEEFELQIGADRYERSKSRLDTRKGEYPRFFTTTFGTSEIKIPRSRKGLDIRYTLFDKYQRRQRKFDSTVILSMLLGFSTRKQGKFFRKFIGDSVSHTTASRLMKNLEADLKEFRTRPIEDKYKYLLVDGFWVKVLAKGKCLRKMVTLVVSGITLDNKKEILAFKLAKGESENEVTALLNDLYRRGLRGKHLKLIASDGSKGIRAAINMVYPYAEWQLCSTHKLRNLADNIRYKVKNRKKMMLEASGIYKSKSRRQAIKRFERFCLKWEEIEPKAIRCFRKDFHNTLAYYHFIEDRRFISTTNHLERDIEEIRRRIKTQGYFKGEGSLNLWVYGIISQFREEQIAKEIEERRKRPRDMPAHLFTLVKEPQPESVQLS